jgi:hypothetical protein
MATGPPQRRGLQSLTTAPSLPCNANAGTSAEAAASEAPPDHKAQAPDAAAAQPEIVDPDVDALLDGALWAGTGPSPAGAPAAADGGHAAVQRAADEGDEAVWEQFGSVGGVGTHAVLAGGASSDDDDGAGAQVSDESDGLGGEMF